MSEPNLALITAEIPLLAAYHHLQLILNHALLWIQNLGWEGVAAFIGIYIIATIALIPGSILTLGAGLVFGVVWGSVYVFIGALIGETCAFLLGRYFARGWIQPKIAQSQVFIALNKALSQDGLKIILLTRLSPIFPFSLLNYAFGVTGISFKNYCLGSIGMIPMTVTYVYFGSLAEDLASIDTASQSATPELRLCIKIFGCIATVIATLYLNRTASQILKTLVDVPPEA